MSGAKQKDVIIFLDVDKHVSPFDVLLIMENFPDVEIVSYSQVEPDDAEKLVQDAMFPRGPAGAKHTKLFISGSDIEKVNAIVEVAKKTMFPPFEMAVIVDPRGANTTASALVAKVRKAMIEKGMGGFEEKKVLILAGTGPIGQVSAKLVAIEGADAVITSRIGKRAEEISRKLNDEIKSEKISGMQVASDEERAHAVADADVIITTGAAGVQLLPLQILRDFAKKCRVVADVNAVPPYGIDGLKPEDDGAEILPGIVGFGAIAIGKLKNKVEIKLVEEALKAEKGVFGYEEAYKIAKSIT